MIITKVALRHIKSGKRWTAAIWGFAMLLLAGCASVGPLASSMFQRAAQPQATGSPALASRPAMSLQESAENRLLILGQDGNIFTIDPDGRKRLNLTTDAGPSIQYIQPTWSSDGNHVAFAEIRGTQSTQLVRVHADGSQRQTANVPYAPFYFFWNPNGDQLAYLSNWIDARQTTIALRVANFSAEQPSVRTLSVGQPLYFSWSPDGSRIVTHSNNHEVTLTELAGGSTVVADHAANFAAPQWLNDGVHLVYAINDAGRQQIVLSNLSGEIEQEIAFNGIASFHVNPNSKSLAFVDTPNSLGTNSFGPLYVFGLEDQIYRQISREPVIYFSWSPDGQSLLYMTVETFRGRIWLHKYIWSNDAATDLGRFQPSSIFFEQHLRFADQYAQSQTYWSPDSSSIVYSGIGENRRNGIWVQSVNDESKPILVASGVHATWSPR